MMVHHGMIFAALIIYLLARYRHQLTAFSSAKYFLILLELNIFTSEETQWPKVEHSGRSDD